MTWVLDEQRRMLRDSAQNFLIERAPVSALRALRDRADAHGHDPALWRAFGEQGYSATLVPEAHDGLGLGACEAGLIAEQIGHTLTASPFFSTAVLSAWLLRTAGSAAQQQQWLPRIDGHKLLVVDGHVADAWIVAARADGGTALLLVPKGTAGVQVERTLMVDAHNAARLRFDGARVGAEALIGSVEHGAALLEGVLDVGRAVIASELLGLADEVFERTVEYLKQRKQFERVIGEFQALQHRAAELFCDLELTRAIVRQAQAALDGAAADAPLRVAQAKARACLTANRAVQEGVQMHGGIGMTDELEIGLFMKRARVLQELFGDAAFQTDRAALLSGF